MKPILIDSRVLKNLAFFAVFLAILVFAGGFLLGYQQAALLCASGGENVSLLSLTDSENTEDDIEQQAAETVTVDDNVEADSPAGAVQPVVQANAQNEAETEVKQQNVKQETPSTEAAQSSNDEKTALQTTSDELRKIKFSIQVGIYGSLKNAKKMADKLQAKNLDAYVSRYLNKDKKERFNVRFGYFKNLKTANLALKNYRSMQQGDGYIVNFTEKGIIYAVEENSQQTAAEPVIVAAPADAAGQQIPETVNEQTPDVLTKTQGPAN